MRLLLDRYDAPCGTILLVTDKDGALRVLEFADKEPRLHRALRVYYRDYTLDDGAAPQSIIHALNEYFAGQLDALDAIPVATAGTPFQQAVWQALRVIPPGKTQSYGQIARQIGHPKASRAVGAANGANPIALVVPCHRVIGASGKLTGYGGGLARKEWLLDFERRVSRGESSESAASEFRLAAGAV